jgi:predicted alpha/beta-hydrolase family hydrolase
MHHITPPARTIIVVGRTDKTRDSGDIQRILLMLEAQGFKVHWFVSDYTRSYEDIGARIVARWPRLCWRDRDTAPRRMLRMLLRLVLVVLDQHRYDHLYTFLHGRSANDARQLRRMLDAMGDHAACIVTHSAGGISATSVADHRAIARIVCFAYPFRHPERQPQAHRTAHLPAVTKPLLIVQGDADDYGADPSDFRRHLPPSARVVSLACGHDCDRLRSSEFSRAWAAVSGFLEMQSEQT